MSLSLSVLEISRSVERQGCSSDGSLQATHTPVFDTLITIEQLRRFVQPGVRVCGL